MEIKIALIPKKYAVDARELSVKLQEAVELGEMRTVDQFAEKLISLADKEHCMSLSEERWHQLIKKVRSFDDDFKSDYLIAKPQLETIIASGAAESFADIASIVEQALKLDAIVLQLPFEKE